MEAIQLCLSPSSLDRARKRVRLVELLTEAELPDQSSEDLRPLTSMLRTAVESADVRRPHLRLVK